MGAYVYPNPLSTDKTCMEVSHFAAYKTQEPCLTTFHKATETFVHDITCIDVQQGLAISQGGGDKDEAFITIEDSFFYGESEADDCPTVGACWC